MLATFAALTGQPAPAPEEGAEDSYNVLPALLGENLESSGREGLVHHDDYNIGPALAIREGDWKLIVSRKLVEEGTLEPIALFNVADNREEREEDNLLASPEQAERVRRMGERLLGYYTAGRSR